MSDLIIRTGSTVAHAAAQAQAAVSSEDYVSKLDLEVSTDTGALGGTGLQLTVSFVKNNGPFPGFSGQKGVTFTAATGSLTQVQNDISGAADANVVGLAVAQLGSPTTGSATYYVIKATTQNDAA